MHLPTLCSYISLTSIQNENHEAMAGLNNKRYWGIYTVLVYVIGLFNPFTFGSSEKERAYKQRTAQGRFAQAKLYPALVKRYVVELYNYVRSTIGKKLDSAKQGRKLKVFSGNLDLWKSKVSGEKYLGKSLAGLFPVRLRLVSHPSSSISSCIYSSRPTPILDRQAVGIQNLSHHR